MVYQYNGVEDTKGKFHTRVGTIKDRSIKDLTEAEEIKKKWQKYRRNMQKGLNDPDNRWCGHSPTARHPGV